MANYNELMKEYRKLAKRADQRLVRLEELSKKQPSVLDWAYKKAAYDAQVWAGKKSEKPRFNVKPPSTERGLQKKIADIKNFLDMKTSTRAGIKSVESKRVDSINERFGTDFSLKDWEQLHQSGVYANAIEKYGFYTATEALGKIEKDAEELILMKQEAEELGMSLSEILGQRPDLGYDAILQDAISNLLTQEGLRLEDLQ